MSKHYKVSKSVEQAKSGRSFGSLVDPSKMEVGDSFTFPCVDEPRVKSFVDTYGRKNGAAFFINMNDHGTCWRSA